MSPQISPSESAVKLLADAASVNEFLEFLSDSNRDDEGLGIYTFRIGDDEELIGTLKEFGLKLVTAMRKSIPVNVRVRHKLIVKSTMRSLNGCKVVAGQIGLKPARINQVSPNDYDIFFNVEAIDADTKFDLQQKLAAEYGNQVRDINDYVQLPGFWNLKDASNPYKMTRAYVDADAPVYALADLAELLADLRKGPFKEVPDTYNVFPLTPLDQVAADPIRPNSIGQVCRRWVWVTGAEQFVNRLDPSQRWRTRQFDAAFNKFADKGSVSRELFKDGNLLRQFDSLCFTPGSGEIQGRNYNICRPSPIKPAEGDTTLWDEHMAYLFPNELDRNLVLDWMAWVLQNLGKKPHYALLLIGQNTGTGKSIIARIFEQLIGVENTQRPKSSSIGGDFNSWIVNCKLAIVEELLMLGQIQKMNALRDTITEPRVEVNIKIVPAFVLKTCLALLAISNSHKALPLLKNDRRWLVVETMAVARDKAYYRRLTSNLLPNDDEELTEKQAMGLGAIYHALLARDLSQYDARGRAPETEAREAMIEASANEWATHLLSVRDEWPLTARVIDPNTIVGVLPKWLQTKDAGTKVRDFLRDYRGGRPWKEQIQPSGRKGSKRRVWVLGSQDTAGKLDSAAVRRMFVEDDKGRADQVDRGTYVFRKEGPEPYLTPHP